MHSMTGFGSAAKNWPEVEVSVEIRAVNSRYLDLKLRLPKEAQALEPTIRDHIQARLGRGRVELALTLSHHSDNQLQLNESLLKSYLQAAARAAELGVSGELDVDMILQLPGVLQPRELDLKQGDLAAQVLQVVDDAVEQVVEARRLEGIALRQDLVDRLGHLNELVEGIGMRADDIPEIYRQKLEKRIATLRAEGSFDEGRLAQEICYYAERSDITEELTRLTTHAERFRELAATQPAGHVGRKLDFLCQEMNREMNTIASKASKAQISELAVEGKIEIEKIREQVQNVE